MGGREGRKRYDNNMRTKKGQVEGHSPEERVATWFQHFKRLLETTIDGVEEDRTWTSMIVPRSWH